MKRRSVSVEQPIKLKGDAVITADWHIPLYDAEYANKMILQARKEKIKTLIIAGDFFNHDALSQYFPKQANANLEFEWKEATSVMTALTRSFDKIIFLYGNHDARLSKALGYTIPFAQAMGMVFGKLGKDVLQKVQFTNLDHCFLRSGRKTTYFICHPNSYSTVPLATSRKLASKTSGLSIITAHAHHCAVGFGPSGDQVVAEIGGLFDKGATAYLKRTTTHPEWVQGYGIVRDGILRVYSPLWELG